MVQINKKFLIQKSLGGDTEKNPKKGFSQTCSIGHWNPNNLVSNSFTKAALLKAFICSKVQHLLHI